jgi:phage tail-like protein
MADDTQYPAISFHFSLDWKGKRVGFTEVTGLTQEAQVIEYRDGFHKQFSPLEMPGQLKFSHIVMKRGVMAADNEFYDWFSTINMNTVERRDVTISLLNEQHNPVMVWKVHNAFPIKMEGPQLKASGNEVAIESIELVHEGCVVQND